MQDTLYAIGARTSLRLERIGLHAGEVQDFLSTLESSEAVQAAADAIRRIQSATQMIENELRAVA